MVRICLVRHGETDWNVQRRIQGHLDVELNAVGVSQARALAGRLATQAFAAIYSSDLSRAQTTAEAVASETGDRVIRNAAWRERHHGAFEGLTYAEAEQRYPAAYAHFAARSVEQDLPGGGESLQSFRERIVAALDEIRLCHARGALPVLVVAHGGVLDLVNRHVRGLPLSVPRDFVVPNVGINWIEAVAPEDAASGWRITAWADVGHLAMAARDEL